MLVSMINFSPDSLTLLNMIASQSKKLNVDVSDMENTNILEKTIDYGHDSIQEFVDYTFHVSDLSRVALAQLTRHRIGISFNVSSNRSVLPEFVVLPKGIKCASGVITLENDKFVSWLVHNNGSFEVFFDDEADIALEDLRYFFPQATTINLFLKFNGRSLRHFLKLRLSPHAQWEVRELAQKIYDYVNEIHPLILKNI